jgi:hypothetical protein
VIAEIPGDALAAATEGIDAAHSKLGVAKLLTPEILTNPDCDDHSMVTYVLTTFATACRFPSWFQLASGNRATTVWEAKLPLG